MRRFSAGRVRLRAVALVAGLLFAIARPVAAIDAATPLAGYSLASWTQKDGIGSSLIWSLALDKVGYLWVGTDGGLLRFDGVRFVSWETFASLPNPRASVRTLLAAKDGTLWFGFGEPGGIGTLRGTSVRLYGTADGLPDGIVMSLAEDASGTIWAAGRFGIYRFSDQRWHRAGDGLPPGVINAIFFDRHESLLAATAAGVYRRMAADATFQPFGDYTDLARSLAWDADARLWTTDAIVGFRPVQSSGAFSGVIQGRGSRLMRDSRGNLWVGTGGQGLWRYQAFPDGRHRLLERTSTATGLSDDGITDLLEDRDGNIWVATRDGLNRLTPHKMTPITDLGLASAVEATRDGRVFVGTADTVVVFPNGRIDSRLPPIRVPSPPLAAMHADEEGTLWMATASQLMRLAGSQVEPLPIRGGPIDDITDITSDGRGGLWIHDSVHGLWRWQNGHVTPAPLPEAIKKAPLLASHTDRHGRAWFSFEGNHVAAVDASGTVQMFGERDGLQSGPYRALHEDRAGALWFGGNALTRFSDGAFVTLSAFPFGTPQLVTGLVDDDEGALWVAINAAGIIRVPGDELKRAVGDPRYVPRFNAYDKVDGSAGTSRWFGSRAAVRSADGALWFVAGRGVTVVDATRLNDAVRSPERVRIEGAVVDGQPLPAAAPVELPPGTARVEIDYTVLNLTSPHRTRFRHRLDGFDADWVDAGARYSASYTNLAPGDYVFRVMAAGAEGTFTDPPAAWRFAIRPMFYQRWWFAIACAAVAFAGVTTAWRLHVRRVRKEFGLLLGERARLSREVHDTLLQSMFGFALECDALREAMPRSEERLRERLKNIRRQIEADMREARQSIWNLRSPRLESGGLAAALEGFAKQAFEAAGIAFTFAVIGTPRPTAPDVEEHLMRIGREAISNAARHSHAGAVNVTLSYEDGGVTLKVADDGQGFTPGDPALAAEHFGLTTMKERAQSVGGTLDVETHAGRGTIVTAAMPLGHA
jgi:signal transduction histidine kinase/ligand-binding sensor domain-containing protein